jgi:hypothetical protein
MVLAGYKPLLWENVFNRLRSFAPDDMDICILTAGKVEDELRALCGRNNWSYLATEKNNIPIVQNIAVELHPAAKFIYKLDEDVLICENYFEGLLDTYNEVSENSHYHVGAVAPLMPVNPHGVVEFLEATGNTVEFEDRFGKVYYDFNSHFHTKTAETLFLWEKSIPIDETAALFAEKFSDIKTSYYICPHRFSIGAILICRDVWDGMDGFNVSDGVGLGDDEKELASYFLSGMKFLTFIMARQVFAMHYSFGKVARPKLIEDFYGGNKPLIEIAL